MHANFSTKITKENLYFQNVNRVFHVDKQNLLIAFQVFHDDTN